MNCCALHCDAKQMWGLENTEPDPPSRAQWKDKRQRTQAAMRLTPLEIRNFLRKRWSTGCPHLLPDNSLHSAGWCWANCPKLVGSPAWSREQEMRPPQPPPAGWPLRTRMTPQDPRENKVPAPLAEFTLWVLTSYRLKITVVMTRKKSYSNFLNTHKSTCDALHVSCLIAQHLFVSILSPNGISGANTDFIQTAGCWGCCGNDLKPQLLPSAAVDLFMP